MEIILTVGVLIGLFILWVNIGATVALSRDDTLESIQRWAQGVLCGRCLYSEGLQCSI